MKTIRLAALLFTAAASPPLAAQSFDMNLGGEIGLETIKNQFVFTSGNLTATVTGWSVARDNANATFQQSQIAQWSPGIGVKNSSETITDIPYVPYYVDNQDHYDFALFIFNKKVDIDRISVNPSGNNFDTDVSYKLMNVATTYTPGGLKLSDLGTLSNNNTSASTAARWVNITTPADGVNAILIGARTNGDSSFDRFKIGVMQGIVPVQTVPEPSCLLLAAASSALFFRRKRAA